MVRKSVVAILMMSALVATGDGDARISIVLPQKPTLSEQFAAKGLRDGLLSYRARVAQTSGDEAAFQAAFSALVEYRASVEADNVCGWAYFADVESTHAGWPH